VKRREKKQKKDEKDKNKIKVKTLSKISNDQIHDIKEVLHERFGVEMPEIEVKELTELDLNAQLMAE
jgi:hypothetical protein